jgi:arylsulfatase A-like enzyme
MRPNIIFITSDQQRTDSLGCYGSAFAQTPNFDRLAAGGVLAARAYCTNPVCTPSRASIFSGQIVSHHGAWNVGTTVPGDVPFLSHYLRDAGYRTHTIGKAHFQPYGAAHEDSVETLNEWPKRYPQFHGPYYGFETVELALGHTTFGLAGHYGAWVRAQTTEAEFQSWARARSLAKRHFGGEAYDWDLPHRLHNSVWTAERSIEFLQRQSGQQPFFLAIGFQDPHHPHCLPRDYPRRVRPEDVLLPEYSPGELEDKPPHFGWAHRGELESSPARGAYQIAGQSGGADFSAVSPDEARLGRSYYYNMIELMGEQLGRILNALDETGLAENTLLVCTTDHGELLGDHGLWMKGPFHYEQLIRVPLLMRWPHGFEGGRSTSSLLSLCDLAPTALAAAGLEIPEAMDGVNALPLLRGESTAVRDHVLVECIDDPRKLRLKTIVTENRKLTRYAGEEYGELYDLENDPRERTNLWQNAEYSGDKAGLLNRLMNDLEPLEHRAPRLCYA